MADEQQSTPAQAPEGARTEEITSDDPHVEPENSTVDDWFGQEVDRDVQAAEQAMEQAGGDPAKAEQIFEQTRPEHESERYDLPQEERRT